jgi:hypothetical protein
MTAPASVVSSQQAEPGHEVRPEYQAMVDGYPALLGQFGVAISATALDDLGVLMRAIEQIDRVLDGTAHSAARAAIALAIVAALRDPLVSSDARLVGAVEELRVMALRRGISNELVAIATEALDNTERMRRARDREHYLACVEREGELTVELALLVAPLGDNEVGRRATAFLRAVAAPANLLDKLVDLRGDHARGEVAVSAGVRTHAAIARRLVARSWTASALHPNRWRFTTWGLRWLVGAHDGRRRPT